MKWFIAQNDQALGPYSDEEMKAFARDGSIIPESYIRREDLAEWITADRINGLFDGVLTIRPPEAPQPIAIQRGTRQAAMARVPHVQTIEKTGKGWKGLQVIGVMVFLMGLFLSPSLNESGDKVIVFRIMAGGLGLFIFARIGAWWNHG
jgi:hypothetical protein